MPKKLATAAGMLARHGPNQALCASAVDVVDTKDALCQVDAERCNLHRWTLSLLFDGRIYHLGPFIEAVRSEASIPLRKIIRSDGLLFITRLPSTGCG